MDLNFHYTIDLNEDQNHQTFFSTHGSSLHHNQHIHHLQAPNFNPSSSSSSSLTSPSLSYLPFLINSHQDQVQVGYNNNTLHGFLDPLETKKFVSNVGSSSSDQMVPKKEARLKLTIRKKDNHQNQIHVPQYPTKGETETSSLKWFPSKVRMMKRKAMITTTTDNNNKQHVDDNQYSNLISNLNEDHLKKISTNRYDVIVNDDGYNGRNNCVIRICSDCNTTKTPLWRSGPRGPKSLCNACGIRQRKARQAAMAAATTNLASNVSRPLLKKKKMLKKNKSLVCLEGDGSFSSPPAPPKIKICKRMITPENTPIAMDSDSQSKSTSSSRTPSSSKFYFDDLEIILSKSSAYKQVFPQDEKEAAILLMALSYGMVHG